MPTKILVSDLGEDGWGRRVPARDDLLDAGSGRGNRIRGRVADEVGI